MIALLFWLAVMIGGFWYMFESFAHLSITVPFLLVFLMLFVAIGAGPRSGGQ